MQPYPEIKNITETNGGGIGFLGLLTIAFLVLKLTGVIGWSWWWIFAPIWAPVVLLIVLLIFIVAAIVIRGRKK